MKNNGNLLWAIVFIAAFCVMFASLEHLFRIKQTGGYFEHGASPVWEIVQQKNTPNIDILFMGASEMLNTADAFVISQMFDKNVYSLAEAGSTIDVTYEKLKIILQYKNIPP
ncbi:MAG: hypothetical protein LBT79_03435 [Elusimicrobiota bacterium]|jgi:hypothetical protein|nr:hypothetical protein [Elusimicrobiota bacterium]